ncbi:CRISPR-associated helicase/endonuclease Cas3 [Actinomadura hibisca]|uniref:CRISPR-associated helicase/endonuclease Cas3 n=1 Tax=Actinomadura hibisca TaxID=68565 RepID=UPI000835C743|nr:CRISPR-associated helicase/endonuclease Cas3 [Actinomadura hibisca]
MSESDREQPDPDARLWGKECGLPRPYPVLCHLIDTAAIVGALYDVWAPGIPALAQTTPTGAKEDMRRLICFWGGLHDIGKVSPSFQVLAKKPYEALLREAPEYGVCGPASALSHNEASHRLLVEIFRESGYLSGTNYRRDVAHQVAQMLGGHHGLFCPAMDKSELAHPRQSKDGLGEGVWEAQSRAHATVLQQLTGAQDPLVEHLPVPVIVVVLGMIITADWLASQEAFISERLPPPGWEATPDAIRAHWECSVADAPGVVREAGLGRAEFADRSFGELFDFDTPNALQASVADNLPGLVQGPGILMVTAPPGDGKTEVALHAAGVLSRACGVGGLGFCLPTMATTDAMHKRVAKFAGRALLGDAALTRVHSMAWLSSDAAADASAAAADADPVISDPAASIAATQWLRAGQRGLFAPLSTFTIDQGLRGVLPVRYNMLRLTALAGKVVVVDEAHAYDAWMNALLIRMLEWLGALKAPVVLLSATLTGESARALVEAYMRGSGHPGIGEIQTRYPGWLFGDAVSGVVSPPYSVPSERERNLRFETRQVRRDADAAPTDERLSVIRELLQPLVTEDRGCVLVCCTTVLEAQETYADLARWFSELQATGTEPPALKLLHARFRASDRARITEECEAAFGKHGKRPRTVLVATQIVEQSLDLDFDLLITDLAPIALLLQRSGRCQRHRGRQADLHEALRPSWLDADPRIVVLDPIGPDGAFEVPKSWGTVYDESLLRRTSRLLDERSDEPIAVPGMVQGLVDAVYDSDFVARFPMTQEATDDLARADGARLADHAAQTQLADLVWIDAPNDRKLRDLRRLSETRTKVDESLIVTRLGADSDRIVCAYEQSPGRWTLDEEGEVPVPGLHGEGRVTAAQARIIAQSMIPVPGTWVREGAELLELPPAWSNNAVLRTWRLLPMHTDSIGVWTGRMRSNPCIYTEMTGLQLMDLSKS